MDKNCNSCKFGLYICETLEDNEKYQDVKIDKSKILKFKETFFCDNYESMYIEYPIEVSKININKYKNNSLDNNIGKFVRVSLIGKEYEGKTFTGLYLGELSRDIDFSFNPNNKELYVSDSTSPAIFIFDLNKIVYGITSYWEIIENQEGIKEKLL